MGKQHQAIAAAQGEAVHRLGDWCKFGRDAEAFATVLDEAGTGPDPTRGTR
jgi:hypothetical protein